MPSAAVPQLAPKDFVRSEKAAGDVVYTLKQAEEYTRWLATGHYENFHIVTFLLPKKLHQDFYNVYAFCRWADDLGDEMEDRQESLRLLAWWRLGLHSMYASGPGGHPVFTALAETAQRHQLPQSLFDDLITAFEHDQRVTRYQNWDEVFDYCRCSANPVGRLVLRLCGYADDQRDRLSDFTCTALQLTNFWQDVTVDLEKNRIYLPLDLLARHGSSEADVMARRFSPPFASSMQEAVGVARDLFHQGLPLLKTVNRRLSFDLGLFSQGGLRILDKIEQQGYDVFRARPRISKLERVSLLLGSLWGLR